MSQDEFTCPNCGHAYALAPDMAGKRGRCKVCKHVFRIPAHPAPPEESSRRPDDDGSGCYEVVSSDPIPATTPEAERPRTVAKSRGEAQAPERPKGLVIAAGMLGGFITLAVTYAVVATAFGPWPDQPTDRARAGGTGSARGIPVSAKSRGGRDSDTSDREQNRARSATVLGIAVDAIGRRANRSTALLEVSIGQGPARIMRTGAAFCVDTTGLFVTHGDVVKGVTEERGQVRLLFGDGLEPRTVAYPTIVRIDDETDLASLRIDPAPELSLGALVPARSADLAPGATVVVLGFPWGRHYLNHDARGQLVDGPRFDFTYFGPWGKEPPDHLIRPLKVRNVWREDGRPSSFDFDEGAGGRFSDLCSGSPALNAAGEVVGILIRPDPAAKETIIVQSSRQGITVSSDAPAPFMGALAAEHLSRFLADAGHPGSPAAAAAEAGHFEMIRKGKATTALVEVSTRAGECSGTAFCIDRSGLFITNAHVIAGATKDPRHIVNLVMDSGLPTQRTGRAEVVRVDPKVDLALLKAEGAAPPEALELGTDGDSAPTMRVTTFGFPLGKGISGANGAPEGSYPQVAINSSRITALGETVRFDGKLNPGNSGGPVLDPRGRVIGVARAGMQFAEINFAISVGRLREFLATPGLQVRMAPVAFPDRARPTRWTIRVVPSPFAKLPEDLAVEVTVADGANAPRRLWAEPDPVAGAGAFRLEFVPRPRDPGRPVVLAVRSGNRIERAVVEDRDVTIGDQTLKLGAIRHLVLRPNPWAYVTDEPAEKGPPFVGPGRVVRGPISGLGEVMAIQDNARKAIDLGAAVEFSVVAVEPIPAPEVGAAIVVHKGDKGGAVVCGTRARLPFSEASA
jgi:S1-C subfamily serine protease